MAEGMEMKDFATPYEDIRTLDALEDIFNDSTYDTVTLDQFRPTKSQQSNIPEIRKELTIQMTNENINRLKTEIGKVRHDIDPDRLAVELHDLRPRILSKKKELYLITDKKNNNVKTITFGKKSYNAARITSLKDGGLLALGTLENALGKNDPLCKLLRGEQETSFTQQSKTAEQSTEQRDKEIEELEELRKQAVSIFGELGNTDIPLRPSGSESSPLIEEIPRRLEQSKELGNVLTDEDRQTIVKYLDFVKQNYNKKIQLLNDIEFNKKAIEDAEKKLATEIEENKINELRKIISDSEANIQSSKQMLDQILAYNERQFEDINMRLKSKFTLREKIGNIFRKYGLTITAITLALGLVIDTIVSALRGGGGGSIPPGSGGTGSGITDKIKQSLKNFSNWLLEMSKKAIDNLPAIIGSIVSFLLKAAASVVGFLAEHLVLFAIALAFALYEALKIGYQDIKRRRK
jgi:hypothetical protein